VNVECAYPLLDRAVDNLRRLNAPQSEPVRNYVNHRVSS
jgi:hypothetical protein